MTATLGDATRSGRAHHRPVAGMPGLNHDQLMTNIELDGHQVIPRVRELLSQPRDDSVMARG